MRRSLAARLEQRPGAGNRLLLTGMSEWRPPLPWDRGAVA